jgi:hypothetical protein
MASRATLKTYFETGDRPSQGQFEAFLDSVLIQDNSEDYLRKSGAEMLIGLPDGSVTAKVQGNRNIIFNPGLGTVSIRGGAGGWVTGTQFRGNNETILGYMGAYGTDSALTNFFIGAGYTDQIVDFYQTSATYGAKSTVFAGPLHGTTSGRLEVGTTTTPTDFRAFGYARGDKGLWANGPYPHNLAGQPGVISFENPVTRFMIGDATGYSFAFSRKTGGVQTDVMTVNEAGFVGVGADINVGTLITGGSNASPARSIIRFKAGTNTYFSGMVFSETYAANSIATKLFLGANSNLFSNALVKHITIDGSNGNVGIGTETPSRKLAVAGSLYADSLSLAPGIWNTSAEATPKNRIFFASDSITYLQGHGAVPLIVRNGSDADMLEVRSTGTTRINGPLFVGVGTASDGRRLLSANYDGSVEGHFASGLVTERSTLAIGLAWGMYQDNTTSWLSGWNYASVRRTALLLDHGSLRFIASPAATTAAPGVALPSQPTTVFYVDSIGQLVTTSSVSCRYGLHIADLDGANAGVSQWLTYKIPGVGQPLNIRDMVNSRQQVEFYPGTTGATAATYFHSRVFIQSGGLAVQTNSTDFGYLGSDNYVGGITYFRSPAGAASGTFINGTTGAATFSGTVTTGSDLRVINQASGSVATPALSEIEFRYGGGGSYLAGYIKGKGYAANQLYADLALSANPNILGSDNLPDDIILRGQTGNVEIIRGAIVMSNATKLGIRTIATLPSAASSSGDRFQVSNSATIANRIAFSNGTAWYYEGTAVAV